MCVMGAVPSELSSDWRHDSLRRFLSLSSTLPLYLAGSKSPQWGPYIWRTMSCQSRQSIAKHERVLIAHQFASAQWSNRYRSTAQNRHLSIPNRDSLAPHHRRLISFDPPIARPRSPPVSLHSESGAHTYAAR